VEFTEPLKGHAKIKRWEEKLCQYGGFLPRNFAFTCKMLCVPSRRLQVFFFFFFKKSFASKCKVSQWKAKLLQGKPKALKY